MADVKIKNGGAVKKEEETKEEDKRFEALVLEKEIFEPTMDNMLLKSTGLCDMVNQIFSRFYLDYEGSTFEIVYGTNKPMICLFFNHRNYSHELEEAKKNEDESVAVACSMNVDDKTENNTLRSLRTMSRRQFEGDRFYLTKEGKEGIGYYLFDYMSIRSIYARGKNGVWVPNWSKIVADVADPNTRYYNPVDNQQFTKVSFVDPVRIVSEIFGRKDETTGEKWDYGVRIINSLPGISNYTGMNTNDNNFLLAIERFSENKIYGIARELNLAVPSGLNIHR